MKKDNSSVYVCQPSCGLSCGYYFSSGLVISETVYSSASHGTLYNAASRVIVDGGRSIMAKAAMAGMLVQNLYVPGYAVVSNTVSPGQTSTISSGEVKSDWHVSGLPNSSGRLLVSGSAVSAIIYSNAYASVFSGGTTYRAQVRGGSLTLVGGSANGTHISNGGILTAMSGQAYATKISSGGSQILFLQGSASSATVSSGGSQIIALGGKASATTILNSGKQILSAGGIASSSYISSGGTNILYNGASAYRNYISSGGKNLISSGGITSYDLVSSGGSDVVSSGGIASSAIVFSGGLISVVSGGSAAEINLQSHGAIRATVYGGDNETLITGNLGTHLFSISGGVAENMPIYNSGLLTVSSGGVASGTVLTYGSMSVKSGGTAYITDNRSGRQTIEAGGTAFHTQNYGSQTVSGTNISGIVTGTGGMQFIYSGGITEHTVVTTSGRQILYGGTANGTSIDSGGSQIVSSGGIASGTEIGYSGTQTVSSGGSAISTVISEGGSQTVYNSGSASSTEICSGGKAVLMGYAVNTIIESGGSQIISSGGMALVIRNAGSTVISNGGSALGISMYAGASLTVNSGGRATGIIQDAGAKITASVEGGDTSTLISGINQNSGSFSLASGLASNFIINSGASMAVSSGGTALSSILSGGGLTVLSGGMASATTIENNGLQLIAPSGTAINTAISSGGQFIFGSGTAVSTTLEKEAGQFIADSGYASETYISSGGLQTVAGTAENTMIFSGGSQLVSDGGYASNTIVSSGARQTISSGGYAANLMLEGTTMLKYGGTAQYVSVAGGGALTVEGNNSLPESILSSGGRINMARTDIATPAVLSLENFTGDGGSIKMRISLENPSDSDQISIVGNHYAGNTELILENISENASALSGNGLKLVEYTGSIDPEGTFSLPGGKMDHGWYEYDLSRGAIGGTGHDIYLRSTGKKAPLAKASMAAPSIAKISINTALNSLQKRLGDLREMDKGDALHGVWGRTYYKSLTVKASDDTDMTVSGLEAGYDRRIGGIDDSGSERMYLGFMAGTASMSGIKGKDSEGDGTALLAGAYYTWIMDGGWFTDFTLRGGQNSLNLKAKFQDSSWAKISPSRSFISLSAEGGRTYDFRRGGTGWKAEPKAELQFMNAGAADASVENGSGKVKFGGASYITAIASANGSYSFIRKNGMLIEPFGEMSYSQDISGSEKITYGTNSENSDMKGGTIELRLGMNMQMKQDLYWHAAASIESGSKKQSFGIDAVIRYMFGKKSAKTADESAPNPDDEDEQQVPETEQNAENAPAENETQPKEPAKENPPNQHAAPENKEPEEQPAQDTNKQDSVQEQDSQPEQPQTEPETSPAAEPAAEPEPDDDEDPFKFMLDF